jgi:hypothetical protein
MKPNSDNTDKAPSRGHETIAGRVFIVQQPKPRADGWSPNFESAREYGRIEFLFDPEDRVYAGPDSAREKLTTKLMDFDPATDYLCWTQYGDPAALWLTIMFLAGALHFRTIKYLYWSRGRAKESAIKRFTNETGFYIPIELTV